MRTGRSCNAGRCADAAHDAPTHARRQAAQQPYIASGYMPIPDDADHLDAIKLAVVTVYNSLLHASSVTWH